MPAAEFRERILEIGPGRGGGAFVHRPGRESPANTVRLALRVRRIRPEALHETREAIEPTCAGPTRWRGRATTSCSSGS
ncbi:hypothetical protein [Streptomyces fuscichromogenes]|uniref:Uncharacterized protein n=1 Tax=Streptomyces fuscichromogenes TaxID=1324013 RepID=A0A917XLC7_9ACTN|nr:hypothetical protein [Streptomyces fuscichromogenes]GGN36654.1 hypothetical protein GCM10011578_080110 [Streptomyces fuscichromogenes]